MIKKDDLLEAIAECNGVPNPNANTCMKLSAYYTILDHMEGKQEHYSYSPPPEIVTHDSGTEFSKAIAGRSTDEVMAVFDELMDTLQVIQPRLYAGVLRMFE